MKKINDTELSNAQLIEEAIRNNINKKSGVKLLEIRSDWVVEQIEMLLNCYPILRKYNYKIMGLEKLYALILSLSEHLEMDHEEQDDLLFVEYTNELKSIMSLKEMFIWILLGAFKGKSHVHFKFDECVLNKLKVDNKRATDYLCDNSYLIPVPEKKEYHFIMSIASVLSFDYKKLDPIVNTILSIQKNNNKHLTLLNYIEYRRTGQNIDLHPELQKQSKEVKIKI